MLKIRKNKAIFCGNHDLTNVLGYRMAQERGNYEERKNNEKWFKVKRYPLLHLLNKKVRVQGSVLRRKSSPDYHERYALLSNVKINELRKKETIQIGHIWIRSHTASYHINKEITFTGKVCLYSMKKNKIKIGIDDIEGVRSEDGKRCKIDQKNLTDIEKEMHCSFHKRMFNTCNGCKYYKRMSK